MILAWLGVLLLAMLAETQIKPGIGPVWSRSLRLILAPLAIWSIAFFALLLILQRPLFALSLLAAAMLLLVLVNNVKWKSLREPFVHQDFEYFTDAILHPRLYVPFFGVWRTLIASFAGVLAVVLGLWLERSLTQQYSGYSWLGHAFLGLLISTLVLVWLSRRLIAVTFEPVQDLKILGFWGLLWVYTLHACKSTHVFTGVNPYQGWGRASLPEASSLAQSHPSKDKAPEAVQSENQVLPTLVVVQSESFFDPRPVYPFINPSVLSAFDKLRDASWQRGALHVPAWGANTVRTESAFLTGLTPQQLGVHRFNPYHRLARESHIPGLVAELKAMGYRCVCIHPYPAGFYRRNEIYPKMGFDAFYDIQHFSPEQKCGQYTSDEAVADFAIKLLENTNEHLFIYIITMENHGPLHLEPQPDIPLNTLYTEIPDADASKDLSVYLYHLQNADRMLQTLQMSLAQLPRPAVLGWFGDHVPIMEQVYEHYGYPSGQTEYLIWRTSSTDKPQQADLSVDELGTALLDALVSRIGE
ncbi:LTA synthase family protein [Nitrincola tibetensis]|uniref:LTA synthase family protein n=1 Tax=Nitrincola tibetensis TaxID=2219697 RepID=A0A364NQJ5_9GAMM|nr:LTA synthase family protein [Nitrincola tibetensis]RAU19165.1 LTA synthase family protein [Nitrincola tibetensis]